MPLKPRLPQPNPAFAARPKSPTTRFSDSAADTFSEHAKGLPLVSVIIPAFNCSQLLIRAVNSVFAQTYKNWECIVIDDGSTDDTAQIIAAFGDRVKSISQSNAGASAARNRGIESARGEYIAFLDADDYWHHTKIAKQVRLMTDHPLLTLVTCELTDHLEGITVEQQTVGDARRAENNPAVSIYQDLLPLFLDPYIGTPTVMVRTDRAREIGGFCPALPQGEDIDFFLRICQDRSYARVNETLTFVHRRLGSLSHSAPSQPYNLEVLDRLDRGNPSFAAEHTELFRQRRLELFEQWAAHHILDGQGTAARCVLRQSRAYGRCSRYWELLFKSILASTIGRLRR